MSDQFNYDLLKARRAAREADTARMMAAIGPLAKPVDPQVRIDRLQLQVRRLQLEVEAAQIDLKEAMIEAGQLGPSTITEKDEEPNYGINAEHDERTCPICINQREQERLALAAAIARGDKKPLDFNDAPTPPAEDCAAIELDRIAESQAEQEMFGGYESDPENGIALSDILADTDPADLLRADPATSDAALLDYTKLQARADFGVGDVNVDARKAEDAERAKVPEEVE